jgi:hypothetical protein
MEEEMFTAPFIVQDNMLDLCGNSLKFSTFIEICEEKTQQVSCSECTFNNRLCNECFDVFHQLGKKKTHQKKELKSNSNQNCPKHQNKILEFYCHDDKSLLCSLCMYEDHKMHNFNTIKEVVSKFKKNLSNISFELINQDLTIQLSGNTREMFKLKENFKNAKEILEEEIKKLEKEHNEELNSLKEKETELNLQLEELMKMKSFEEEEDKYKLLNWKEIIDSNVWKLHFISKKLYLCGLDESRKENEKNLKSPVEFSFFKDIRMKFISCGGYHFIGLDGRNFFVFNFVESGKVFTWGNNKCGQLGVGNVDSYTHPIELKFFKDCTVSSLYSGLGQNFVMCGKKLKSLTN